MHTCAYAYAHQAVELDAGSMLAAIQLGMALHRNQQATEARSIFEQVCMCMYICMCICICVCIHLRAGPS